MKNIPSLPGYFATADGNILSDRSGSVIEIKQRNKDGYMHVTLSVLVGGERQRHRRAVHRLVLEAFKGAPPADKPHGRHLDGNSQNNCEANLQWGTPRENAADAVRHGTLGSGMRAHRRKLTEQQVIDIKRRLAAGERDQDLAREYGVVRYYPNMLAAGKCWPHVKA